MKRNVILSVFLVVTLIVVGCTKLETSSSREEVTFATSHLSDFEKLLSLITITERYFNLGLSAACIYDENKISCGHVFHVVVYKTKNGKVNTIIWDGSRPPKQIVEEKK